MKTAQMLLFVLIVVAGNLCADQKIDSVQAGRIFRNNICFVAKNCDYLSRDIQERLLRGGSEQTRDLKLSAIVSTYTSSIQGKDLFDYARAKQCENCGPFLAKEKDIRLFVEVINRLEIGDLTMEVFEKKITEDPEFEHQLAAVLKEIQSKKND